MLVWCGGIAEVRFIKSADYTNEKENAIIVYFSNTKKNLTDHVLFT